MLFNWTKGSTLIWAFQSLFYFWQMTDFVIEHKKLLEPQKGMF